MRKDAHLLDAALVTDRVVISADDLARELFSQLSASLRVLKSVIWLTPEHEPDRVPEWLKRGADPARRWQLATFCLKNEGLSPV